MNAEFTSRGIRYNIQISPTALRDEPERRYADVIAMAIQQKVGRPLNMFDLGVELFGRLGTKKKTMS